MQAAAESAGEKTGCKTWNAGPADACVWHCPMRAWAKAILTKPIAAAINAKPIFCLSSSKSYKPYADSYASAVPADPEVFVEVLFALWDGGPDLGGYIGRARLAVPDRSLRLRASRGGRRRRRLC